MGSPWAIRRWLILGGIAWSLGSCELLLNGGPTVNPEPTEEAVGQPVLSAMPSEAEISAPSSPSLPPDTFREAVNRATSAVAIGQSAQSIADWQLAASRWQQAIALMAQVPPNSPNHAQAQTKVQEYQQHLAAAQRRTTGPIVPAAAPTPAPPTMPAGLAAQIPIQRRQGGTPVVGVTLKGVNGTETFPMLFDTGATGTLITAEMAQAVGVAIVGETQARIADGSVVKLPIGYVDVVNLGGLRQENVKVAIGGSYGLLGQDIYGQYGIAIGSQMIHLHQ